MPFSTMILEPFIPVQMPVNADGAFKVPSLRNVELTAPYFHNGSVMTLDGAVNFYSRGGNFPDINLHQLDPVIGAGLTLISNNQTLHEALVDFLTALTDRRVKKEMAPFDHPEIFIPEGSPEALKHIPATSSDGSVFRADLSINPVMSPTSLASQIISGTVDSGAIPAVTVNTAATVGPVTVNDTMWSCEIGNLAEGANEITVSALIEEALATVTAIIEFNSPPQAMDDSATTELNASVVVDVLANDTDLHGTLNPASVAIATSPVKGGKVLVNPATGAVTYTPSPNFVGEDMFTYTVSNNRGVVSNAATVLVTAGGALDQITVTAAKFKTKNAAWVIQGKSSAGKSTLIFRVGSDFGGAMIGSVRTNAKGKFKFSQKKSAVAPDASNTISLQASNGSLLLGVPVTVK